MMQYLIIAGLIAFIYFFYFRKPSPKVSTKERKKERKEDANEMVECAACGVYSELDDAIFSNAKYYCCDECVAKSKR